MARGPVGLDDDRGSVAPPGRHLVDDGQRVLGPGIVRREHDLRRPARSPPPPSGAACAVPVPAAAEHAQHPAVTGQRPSRGSATSSPAGVWA